MLAMVANVLVIAGAALLIGAMWPMQRLVRLLPAGRVVGFWRLLAAMNLLFLLGYAGYGWAFWGRNQTAADMIVPVVFFLGAWFVLLTALLTLQTAVDLRRVAALEQENITDGLTGVHNRRYVDRRMVQELARAQRHSLPLAALLLDIDHFKAVNDTHGHVLGDEVLRQVAQAIKASVRVPDIVGRYGGEEFVAILPDTPLAAAVGFAERMRRNIEGLDIVLPGAKSLRVTVSVGVAAPNASTADAAALLHAADRALYRAKREGRNRTLYAGPAGGGAVTPDHSCGAPGSR